MKIIQLFLLFLYLLFLPKTSLGNDFNVVDFFNNIDTMRAEFTQINKGVSSTSAIQGSGEIFLEKPNKLFWEMLEPYKKTMVINGSTMIFYDEDLNQALISDYIKDNNSSWINLFMESKYSNDAQLIKEQTLIDDQYYVSFMIDDFRDQYKSVIFVFQNERLNKVKLEDLSSQTIEIEFTAFEINPIIKETLFNFTVPQSADVLDQRGE
ncbi:outer-membrane lipoprotein carrier protein LolA [Gammaproteobacteria bacterium]|nr:outer-membrane lipoprotein carrier protein LolA [Gammaproteobacteria bacterium]